MKQWWFRYAIRQLIEKLIILRLLFIYFNYAFNQLINQSFTPLPPNSVSMFCMVALAGAKSTWQCHALLDLLLIYLAWQRCTLNVPVLVEDGFHLFANSDRNLRVLKPCLLMGDARYVMFSPISLVGSWTRECW